MASPQEKEQILQSIGFTKNEAKIYLALLELGTTTATIIAKKTKIHRANVYDALQNLIQKGLVGYETKNKTKLFHATDPENLKLLLQLQEKRLEKIIPELKLAAELSKAKAGESFVYEGIKPFINLLHNFLKYKEPILVYGIPKTAPDMLKTYIPHFHKKRIALKIPMYHIYNYDAIDRIRYLNSLPYTEAGYIEEKIKSSVSTNICGPEVVLSVWRRPPLVVQIISPQVAESYKEYFHFLWQHVKKE